MSLSDLLEKINRKIWSAIGMVNQVSLDKVVGPPDKSETEKSQQETIDVAFRRIFDEQSSSGNKSESQTTSPDSDDEESEPPLVSIGDL
jgi:hypothetical protein